MVMARIPRGLAHWNRIGISGFERAVRMSQRVEGLDT